MSILLLLIYSCSKNIEFSCESKENTFNNEQIPALFATLMGTLDLEILAIDENARADHDSHMRNAVIYHI